jgi:rubredoxin
MVMAFLLYLGVVFGPIILVTILLRGWHKRRQGDYWANLPQPRTSLPGQMVCPKCQQPMVQGFQPDHTYGGVGVSIWVEGPPQKSFWKGTAAQWEKSIPVGTFRCSSCGYLECYARPEFEQQ